MTLALHQIVKSTQPIWSESGLRIEMAFGEGARWLSDWSAKGCCESISLEKIESLYPVQFVRLEKQPETMNFSLEFKALAACQVRWITDMTLSPPRAPKGFKAAMPTKIESLNTQGEWVAMPSQGSTDLTPGTHERVNLWGLFPMV